MLYYSRDRGTLTLGILFGIVFLSTVALLTMIETSMSEHIAGRFFATDRAYGRALARSLERIRTHEDALLPTDSFFEDLYSEGRFGATTIGVTARIAVNRTTISQGTALLDGATPGSPRFPFVDLDHLLSAPQECHEPLPSEVGRTPGGHLLTPGSLTSAETCHTSPNTIARGGPFAGNIVIPVGAVLQSPMNGHGVTLATSGFIEASSPLTIRGTALIVAGGDLFIAALEASEPSMASLVAVTGRIAIGYVSPNLLVRAFGFAGVDLPPATNLSTAPPLPPLRERLVVGVKRGPP